MFCLQNKKEEMGITIQKRVWRTNSWASNSLYFRIYEVYFTATLMALSPNFAMTMVSDTAQEAVPSTAEEEPISLPSAT